MKLQTPELLEEYCQGVLKDYPELTEEQCREMCLISWRYVKKEMESGDLPDIRMKYLGVFSVYKGSAINQLKSLPNKLKSGKITQEKFGKLEKMITKRIERYENK